MSTCVCVLSNSGERLMPTFRLGKVRHLLKDGKAKIVKHHPFTIQLLYDSKTNTQPIEICEDVGYNYIGISVKSQSHEYLRYRERQGRYRAGTLYPEIATAGLWHPAE